MGSEFVLQEEPRSSYTGPYSQQQDNVQIVNSTRPVAASAFHAPQPPLIDLSTPPPVPPTSPHHVDTALQPLSETPTEQLEDISDSDDGDETEDQDARPSKSQLLEELAEAIIHSRRAWVRFQDANRHIDDILEDISTAQD